MNSDRGYTRQYRRLWDNPVFRSKQEAAVFAWMISEARWQPAKVRTTMGIVDLDVGEMLVSERQLAADFGLHRNVVRALMQRMLAEHMVGIRRPSGKNGTNAGTIVRIENYQEYQSVRDTKKGGRDQSEDQLGTSSGPARDQPIKIKEGKEGKEESPPTPHGGRVRVQDEFENWWKVFPKRVGKAAALRKYLIARKTADPPTLLEAARRYAAIRAEADPQYTAQPAAWLHQGRWEDDDIQLPPAGGRDRPTEPPPRPEDVYPELYEGTRH